MTDAAADATCAVIASSTMRLSCGVWTSIVARSGVSPGWVDVAAAEKNGGTAVAVGLGQGQVTARHLMTFVTRERAVVGAYGAEPGEVAEVLRLLAGGRLRLPHVVGDVIGLGDVADGLRRVARGDTGGSRIVLDIHS